MSSRTKTKRSRTERGKPNDLDKSIDADRHTEPDRTGRAVVCGREDPPGLVLVADEDDIYATWNKEYRGQIRAAAIRGIIRELEKPEVSIEMLKLAFEVTGDLPQVEDHRIPFGNRETVINVPE